MKVKSGHKYRIYPTVEQQASLAIQFGSARFVYNKMLSLRSKCYQHLGRNLSHHRCITLLSRMKKMERYSWMRQADSQVLQQSVINLKRAFEAFFEKRGDYPTFKKKHGKQSIRYPQRFKLNGNRIYLPKVGWVKVVLHRALKGKMRSCTVSKTRTGRYYVSILCEYTLETALPTSNESIGIDVGLSHFATLSTGEKIENPRHLKKYERRLKIRQRRKDRKVKGSNNREKARHNLAITHEKVANQRRDFHHKLSRRLVNEFGRIAVEDLNVSGMMKNHKLAKAIADAGWSQFIGFLTYKQDWNTGVLAKVGRFYASTKTCSNCGFVNKQLTLKDRVWTCPSCGCVHDRDRNASTNIRNEAFMCHVWHVYHGKHENNLTGVSPVENIKNIRPDSRNLRLVDNMIGVQSHDQGYLDNQKDHGFSRSDQESHTHLRVGSVTNEVDETEVMETEVMETEVMETEGMKPEAAEIIVALFNEMFIGSVITYTVYDPNPISNTFVEVDPIATVERAETRNDCIYITVTDGRRQKICSNCHHWKFDLNLRQITGFEGIEGVMPTRLFVFTLHEQTSDTYHTMKEFANRFDAANKT